MIKGYCRTNLDDYERDNWPEVFVSVPRKGEYVQSKQNNRLKVVCIIHYIVDINKSGVINDIGRTEPRIEVELNK